MEYNSNTIVTKDLLENSIVTDEHIYKMIIKDIIDDMSIDDLKKVFILSKNKLKFSESIVKIKDEDSFMYSSKLIVS